MKKVSLSILVISLFSSAATYANSNDLIVSKNMIPDSRTAMHSMKTLKLTGIPSYDFIAGMLPHHEGAIIMSEKKLPLLTNPKIRQLAENIIQSQKEEVIFMKKWLVEHKTINPKDIDLKASQEMMNKSMQAMRPMMTVKLTGNPNIDFVEGMLPHHEGAIKMAEVIMPYLKNQQIKTFASNIIKTQKKEVYFMKSWLAKQN
ncbi:hypothetical protein CTM97_18465 [Photobacterium phosphoreum]|uniref:DUF305 domain-containing protein n=1 Tax=Photobacterium phosphoreum TaxID=659 RepID=A0A2T3JBT9_PHOPO|nr:DUF305 domain-containing protein [Photobacterium phosphoreum]PSU19923.1 hypothetical protein CTM96_20445 [Photobacterium phosphoreum]PSU38772.1 hypothetical protein CTM97_18465 [Photobacterium phosphoreum]PSU46305.1 hypothetical protein C9J18_20785 [Photobacterium phosphoreum]